MNLVEVSKWIQEGYRKYYYGEENGALDPKNKKAFIFDHVIKLGRGQLNPRVISDLIDLETSVGDETWIKL